MLRLGKKTKIELIRDDITKLLVDAIVNAANNSLLGGGGVDGAIHRAAGKGLYEECLTLNGCDTGEAKITGGYNLPAKYVIHTVGPVWKGGKNNEDKLLANCYINSLNLAKEYKLKTIAFPNISTGVYGFPKQRAAIIALHNVREYIAKNKCFDTIFFVCFDEENYGIYESLLKE
ncbi:MAG: O-acetyl-ADP-ribose deacetylase [Marinilabiliales bacterium]